VGAPTGNWQRMNIRRVTRRRQRPLRWCAARIESCRGPLRNRGT
jgi:hypothetical protein